jgi:hypothetical protein
MRSAKLGTVNLLNFSDNTKLGNKIFWTWRPRHDTKLVRIARDKYSNLLEPFVSYEEKCCEYGPKGVFVEHLSIQVTLRK